MTYSQELKEELARIELCSNIDKKVQLIAVLKSSAVFTFNSEYVSIDIRLSSRRLTKDVFNTIKENYPSINIQTLVQKVNRFSKRTNVYIIRLSHKIQDMLFDLDLIDNAKSNIILSLNKIVHNFDEEQTMIYIRTCFICCGTVNDPRRIKQYHLEFTSQNEEYLKEIQKVLKEYEINLKISKRRNNIPLYLNKSEEIADILKYMGSTNMLFEYEDIRIQRDMVTNLNRMNNADIANEEKSIKAAQKQIKAIKLLKEKNKFSELSQKTKDIAKLRIENEEDSLLELSKKTNGDI
ncbi:MAG: DNA-binding protein WhiA [Mycoplasmatales bacterium]